MKATQTQTSLATQQTDVLVEDFKSATFIVSVLANFTLFVFWVTLQLHT